ncbi:hypothetical protein [uncultured Pseudoteredinibacter sp.]|uniref:hypothetical protein n=1 Tax=uncultured Pseudoteredinibacter sp. TaxID=1641701 RepID=UPI00263A349F|nr:hypothetical protein [uncultured Pseudoteredinibacter sp.]
MVGFFVLAAVIFGVVAMIPYCVAIFTDSQQKDSEFREIFWREAGWRGHRIVCSLGCFWPISFFSGLPSSAEGFVVFGLFFAYCVFEHSKLYRGVKVFNAKLSACLLGVVLLHVALHLLFRFHVIDLFLVVLVTSLSSLYWGWFVTFKRSKVIAAAQSVLED